LPKIPLAETGRHATPNTARSILVTGCSSGIGLCAAHGLQARGHRVIASARRAADVQRLRDAGLTSVQLDLADSASIARAVAQTLEHTGGELHALFNNAAYGQPGAVEDLSRAVLREQFETNLFGTLELTNRIIPVMRRQGHGRIIQNGSVLGLVALPYRGAYNASKFALEGLSDTLRLELTGSGIHVSLIEPGPITSRFRANAFTKYQEHIDVESSAHRDVYRRMENRLQKEGPAAPLHPAAGGRVEEGRARPRITPPTGALLRHLSHLSLRHPASPAVDTRAGCHAAPRVTR